MCRNRTISVEMGSENSKLTLGIQLAGLNEARWHSYLAL